MPEEEEKKSTHGRVVELETLLLARHILWSMNILTWIDIYFLPYLRIYLSIFLTGGVAAIIFI